MGTPDEYYHGQFDSQTYTQNLERKQGSFYTQSGKSKLNLTKRILPNKPDMIYPKDSENTCRQKHRR